MAPAALCGPALAEVVDSVPVPQLTPNTQRRLMLPEGALQRTSSSCTQKPAARQEACQPGQAYASPSPSPSSCSASTLVTPINAATTQWRTLRCPCAPGPSEACLLGSGDTPFAAPLTVWPSPTSSPLVGSPSPVAFGASPTVSPASGFCTPSDVATTAWRRSECPFAPARRQGKHPAASLEASPLAASSPLASSSPGTLVSPVLGNTCAFPMDDTRAVFVPFSRGLVARLLPNNSSHLAPSSAAPGSTSRNRGYIGTHAAGRIPEEIAEISPSTSSSITLGLNGTIQGADTFGGLSACHVPSPATATPTDSGCDGPAVPQEDACSHATDRTASWSWNLGA
mmetsp:Transcript_1835/g.4513  ORF Transcript_1835/g.4513 Transcript_1835/m.4513 type:complete len:341 (+) Transcript_1835:91-1113(+)